MGFLGLVPADQVTAIYLVESHMLRLHASGTVPVVTSGIRFDRQPLLGGLKFALEGWTGPLTGETESYKAELEFSIQLPNPALPSDYLTVVTANHPKGLQVPIRFTGLIVPPKTADRHQSPLLPLSQPTLQMTNKSTPYTRPLSRLRRTQTSPAWGPSKSNSTTNSLPSNQRALKARISSGHLLP